MLEDGGDGPERHCGRNRPLTDDPGLGAGEVDDGRGGAGQLAAVDEGGRRVPELGRDVVEAATAPAPARTASAAPATAGTRTPSVSARAPVSHGYRRAGFGTISV
jgi:hypothetical protein